MKKKLRLLALPLLSILPMQCGGGDDGVPSITGTSVGTGAGGIQFLQVHVSGPGGYVQIDIRCAGHGSSVLFAGSPVYHTANTQQLIQRSCTVQYPTYVAFAPTAWG